MANTICTVKTVNEAHSTLTKHDRRRKKNLNFKIKKRKSVAEEYNNINWKVVVVVCKCLDYFPIHTAIRLINVTIEQISIMIETLQTDATFTYSSDAASSIQSVQLRVHNWHNSYVTVSSLSSFAINMTKCAELYPAFTAVSILFSPLMRTTLSLLSTLELKLNWNNAKTEPNAKKEPHKVIIFINISSIRLFVVEQSLNSHWSISSKSWAKAWWKTKNKNCKYLDIHQVIATKTIWAIWTDELEFGSSWNQQTRRHVFTQFNNFSTSFIIHQKRRWWSAMRTQQ